MPKLPSLALAAVASLGLLTVNAYAMRTFPTPPPPGNPNTCTALCPPSGGSVEVNYRACGDKLAQLPKVTIRDVRSIDPSDTVHLVPLCDVVNHSLTAEQTAFLARGNAGGLLSAIGANPTLTTKLVAGGYRADDVLGMLLGSNAAVLYVHRQ